MESDIDIDEISYISPIYLLCILLELLNKVKSLIYKRSPVYLGKCISVVITSVYNSNLSIGI